MTLHLKYFITTNYVQRLIFIFVMSNTISRNDAEMLARFQLKLNDYMREMAGSIMRIKNALDNSNWHDRQRRVLENRLKKIDFKTLFMHLDIEKNYLLELKKKVDLYNNK